MPPPPAPTDVDRTRPSATFAAAILFLAFAAYYMLRPLREEVATELGRDLVDDLWLGTAVATLLGSLLLGWLLARLRRRTATPLVLLACAAIEALFPLLDPHGAAGEVRAGGGWAPLLVAGAFYVWVSSYHMLVLALFWGLMADLFGSLRSRRTFGAIAFGGTLGGLVGTKVTANGVEALGAVGLTWLAAGVLGVAGLGAALWVRRAERGTEPAPPLRGSAIEGLVDSVRSPFLLGIIGYVLLQTFMSSMLYLEQTDIVRAHYGGDRDARTVFFAELDFWVQSTTMLIQLLLTPWLMRRVGTGLPLAVQPLVCVAGFAALALAPAGWALMVFAAFEGTRRVANYALAKPSRDALFTVVPPSDRYKAKAVIDAAVYRGSDVAVAKTTDLWRVPLMAAAGSSAGALALVCIPMAAGWAWLSARLGREHGRRERAS